MAGSWSGAISRKVKEGSIRCWLNASRSAMSLEQVAKPLRADNISA